MAVIVVRGSKIVVRISGLRSEARLRSIRTIRINCHPERSEGSSQYVARSFANAQDDNLRKSYKCVTVEFRISNHEYRYGGVFSV